MSGDHKMYASGSGDGQRSGWRKRQVMDMAREAGIEVHERKQQARVGLDALCGIDSTAKLERFAELVRADERERIYAEQLELPEPRLTGKFSITAGKFKCTGCTGTWTDREDAKHHSCKDYQ